MAGLNDIAVAALMALSAWGGVQALPRTPDPAWRVERPWDRDGPGWVLQAVSTAIPEACRTDPGARVAFPRVILGAHEIRLDGRVTVRVGDPRFQRLRSMFGAPSLPCADLAETRELVWSVWSPTRVFARLSALPRLTHAPDVERFATDVLPVMAAGSLLAGALFCSFLFRGVAPDATRRSLVATGLAFGVYCLASVAGVVGLPLSVLAALRLANVAVLIGAAAFANLVRIEGLLPRPLVAAYITLATLGIAIQVVAPSGDVAHLGTFLTVPFGIAMLALAFGRAARRIAGGGVSLRRALEIGALGLLVMVVVHDALVMRGTLPGPPLGPIAMLGGVMFFALGLHAGIVDAFRERDFLRLHLEAEVLRKTAESGRRAQELARSLEDLRRTQAQLVHSEKMASLGVVVAGVAHELNNPISFIVSNAEPLSALVQEAREAAAAGDVGPVASALDRIACVVAVMRRGAERTAGIVGDLRGFSRRGTGETVVVDVHEGIEVSLRLLRARWADRIEIVREFGPPLRLRAPCGELNQVFMNLLANACDAIAETGHVWIRTGVDRDRIAISVRDDGSGIAAADLPRIFDPFFSTKETGKGTGLGLAVSHGVVTRLGGEIAVESVPGVGTAVTVRLPGSLTATSEAAA